MVTADIPLFLTAKTINNDKVINMAGEHLGKIEDLMIDLENGKVAYAVLSFGGFLGLGNKLFAVPWEALSVRPHEHAFALNVSKETLENAEGFDKDNWPLTCEQLATSTREWLGNIYTCYGYKPYWETGVPDQTDKERPGETESERMTRIKSESHVPIAKEEIKAEEAKAEKAEEARAEVARIEKARDEKARAEGAEEARVEAAKLERAKVEKVKAEETKVEEAKLEGTKIKVEEVEEAQVEPIHPSENRGGKKRSLLDTCK
jgi:primosomal protein N'